jgi:thiol:disulfide interchange protein DsbD
MGLTMGIIAAPCIGPFVFGLLTYVGELGKPLLGFTMFFTLAWGIGLPFLVLGTISGSISRLPRSGDWMVWVRKIFGFILVAMALYFVRHLLPPRLVSIGYAAIAIAGGVYLGWIDRAAGKGKGFAILKRAVGVLGIAIGAAFLLLPSLRGGGETKSAGIAWQPFSEEAVLAAAREGKPVVIDFSAEWCALCHELDKKTFADPAAVALSAGFVPLRADLTKPGPAEKEIRKKYGIRGLPVIMFIDSAGSERTDLRTTGFIDAAEFARRVKALSTPGK